jgi:hypothetical protein
MITAAAPQSFERRGIALSLAFHCCAAALVALIPLGGASIGAGTGSVTGAPVFIFHVQRRQSAPAKPVEKRESPAPSVVSETASQPMTVRVIPEHRGNRGRPGVPVPLAAPAAVPLPAAVVASAAPPTAAPATDVPAAEVAATAAAPAPTATARVAALGPANWGSRWDTPTLRDRALLDETLARIGRRGSVTIAVDDSGRATEVRIVAPGLDAAAIEDLRQRLLAARYLPVERDGIAFAGTMQLKGR